MEGPDGRVRNGRISGGNFECSQKWVEFENAEEILTDDEFADAIREKCIKTSTEMYRAMSRYTNSEASTIVRSVTGLDGVEA